MRGRKFGGTAQTDWLVTVWDVHHVSKDILSSHRNSETASVNSLSSVLNNIGVLLRKIAQIKNVVKIRILT